MKIRVYYEQRVDVTKKTRLDEDYLLNPIRYFSLLFNFSFVFILLNCIIKIKH